MESLNLNNLAKSLPSSSYANAEKELTNNFRAAALSLTTLFRSSKSASKRAYNAGYSAACHDLLNMIQQGVSTDADPSREVTIGRIMDYIEARLEAIRAREEEEDEEEEKERAAKGGPPSTAGPSAAVKPALKASSPTLPPAPTRRDQPIAPPTPYTPSNMEAGRAYATPTLSSPTPSVLPLRPLPAQATMQPLARASIKSRLSVNPKDLPSAPMSFTYDPPAIADVSVSALASSDLEREPHLFSFPAVAASTPLKRRREVLSAADGAPNPDGGAATSGAVGTSRRRTRSWRGDQAKQQHQQRVDGGEAMDVEEEGPQRKRVARR
ncbi:hypothetical protein V8D89_006653 [Ganoderma adspersum]